MHRAIIGGIGVEIPETSISNDELVASFNDWIDAENAARAVRGEEPLQKSDAAFIEHASGIRNRHVYERSGILDSTRMTPRIPARVDEDLSVMAEFGLASARKAIAHAGVDPSEIDMVICSAAHHQRPYPAIAIEIQNALGIVGGAAFDMNLGCSSAVAGLHVATSLVRSGAHRKVLVVTPEIITGHLNFRDRQTHFIFGDAAAAMVVEALDEGEARPGAFEILDTRNWTQFSSNIRSNFGFLNRAAQDDQSAVVMEGRLITQVGNKVFKEVTVAAHHFMRDFLADNGLTARDVRRFWLHQANGRMNAMILKLVLGGEADHDRAPMVLSELGNTAAAGAVVAFDQNHDDLKAGDIGLFCAFGAGYSIGGAILRRL